MRAYTFVLICYETVSFCVAGKAWPNLFTSLVALLLAACAAQPAQLESTPIATAPAGDMPAVVSPVVTAPYIETPTAPPPLEIHPEPEAAAAARRKLAAQLGIPPEMITVSFAEQTEWADACLGFAQAGEMCAEVLTPGFRIELSAYGKTYEAHTDQVGDQVRLADTTVENAGSEAAVKAAVRQLSEELGINVKEITLVSVRSVKWKDTCLGI